MAKWKDVNPGTGGSLRGSFEYESGASKGESTWQIYQDEKPFLEQAKMDRESIKKSGMDYKKFATIPDIVAIEIAEKYGIDIHDPATMQDKHKMNKFKYIISTDYAYLLSY